MERMTGIILATAPVGVACLIAKTTSESTANDVFGQRLGQLFMFALRLF